MKSMTKSSTSCTLRFHEYLVKLCAQLTVGAWYKKCKVFFFLTLVVLVHLENLSQMFPLKKNPEPQRYELQAGELVYTEKTEYEELSLHECWTLNVVHNASSH